MNVKWPMYQLTKEGKSRGHLFGTTHVGTLEMYPFPKWLEKLIAESSVLVTEINMEEFLNGINPKEMLLPAGQKITDDMNEESIEKFIALLQKVGIPLEQVEGTKMSFISMMVTFQKDLVYDAEYAVESKVKELVPQLQNLGLETIQQQLEMLESVYADISVNEWVDVVSQTEGTEQQLHHLMESYITGDIEHYFETYMSGQKKLNEELLIKSRNKNWVPQIIEIAEKSEQPLFAVGAGHLYGEMGLLQLLKNEGYDIVELIGE